MANHGFDSIGLFLTRWTQKYTVVLEDAGNVVCMCDQSTADVWNTEFCSEAEVVATRGKKVGEGWSHFTVVLGHLYRAQYTVDFG